MRPVRAGLGVCFAAALTVAFYIVCMRWPPVTWIDWALLTVGVSMLGGIAIGRRWAVGVALGVNAVLSLLLLAIVAGDGTLNWHAYFLLVQMLVSTGVTAAAVRFRSGPAGRLAEPA